MSFNATRIGKLGILGKIGIIGCAGSREQKDTKSQQQKRHPSTTKDSTGPSRFEQSEQMRDIDGCDSNQRLDSIGGDE